MWQVAVYSPHQHDQFRATGDHFELRRANGERSWRLHDSQTSAPPFGQTIRLRVSSDSLFVDCRELNESLELASGGSFSSDVPVTTPLPALFQLGGVWIEVRPSEPAERLGLEPLHSLHQRDPLKSPGNGRGPDSDTVAKWLSAAGQLHRMAASSPQFFEVAAQIALDCTGLNSAFVLMREGHDWAIAGSAVLYPQHGISYEPAAVEVIQNQSEVWRRPPRVAGDPHDRSSDAPESVIVAPVRDDAGAVVAAVYGVRHGRGDNRRHGIRALEARVIETIAEAVGAGLARRQQEMQTARQQVLLEQAFSPDVAAHLQRHPEALRGQMKEVTLMFADLRDFTSIAERLCPSDACDLVGSVMEMLTQAILDHRGTVVDYYGDGVCAMWNAPLEIAAHADLACAAAMQMLASIGGVSDQWNHLLPNPLQLGIGLHAGAVQVGNAGTARRLKYGPRGSAVNIASRVQSAAKRLDVALLATDAVRSRLTAQFVTLKVCSAQLSGLSEPFDLYTVFPSADGERLQADLERYSAALAAFELGDLETAERELEDLLAAGQATPANFLAQQAAALRQSAAGRRSSDEFSITPDAVIQFLAK